MDLSDIFTAFSQSQASCDEDNMKTKESGGNKVRKYEFGTIIENEGAPCYKVEK